MNLQHLYHPEFFDAGSLAFRETMYRAGCNFAQAVIVNSTWIKDDVVRQYRMNPGKIHVVQEAPPATSSSSEPSESLLHDMRTRYGLEQRFLFYPGVTWPHKNHSRLFEALAFLRDTYRAPAATGVHRLPRSEQLADARRHYAGVLFSSRR